MNYLSILSNGLIIDTGPLLLLTFCRYNEGRYLEKVRSYIPKPDIKAVSVTIQQILSAVPKAAVTSYVLGEFHALAGRELDSEGVIGLMSSNYEMLNKIEEITISKGDILRAKQERTFHFCFADTSLMLAAMRTNMPVLTIDRELGRYCKANNIPSLDLYYECFVNDSWLTFS
ncbi:MAG: hypothetical protein PHR43_00095 [Dehalococcoidales bacterium]|nr:hypothetical protein [Dehalococcoidales bacterium]